MRASFLVLLGCLSLSYGQWVEATIYLPDSVSGLSGVGSLVSHPPNNMMYVGGNQDFLISVDALTGVRLARVTVGNGPHLLCSDRPGNKVYCTNDHGSLTVISGATNQSIKTFPVEATVTDLVYNGVEDKLYCGNADDSLVRVVDCAADSIVARIPVSGSPSALCYNPQLNRIYCVHRTEDEVSVIDCAADTVVATIWVQGVEPLGICYDSATNSVYTVDSLSNAVTVIDCAGDTVTRLVRVGLWPRAIAAGPPGKVYCANYGDSSVSVILPSGVKTVKTCRNPRTLGYDPANDKVYCASYDRSLITVVDCDSDSAIAQVATGSRPTALCWNPADSNTYIACRGNQTVAVVDGASDTVEAVIQFGPSYPGPLCYSTANNHLYCLDRSNEQLYVIDGETNLVLKSIKTGSDPDSVVWNPASNKVYLVDSGGRRVSVLDCENDSIIVSVALGQSVHDMCVSDLGKVYVVLDSGVAVIDGIGDTIRTVVPIPTDAHFSSSVICYDRIDKRAYVGRAHADTATLYMIDAGADSLRTSIQVWVGLVLEQALCWEARHDKLYICHPFSDTVTVIDCAGDTILRKLCVTTNLSLVYNDSVCDKVYCFDRANERLRIANAATDTFYRSLAAGYVNALLDNGKPGPANRLYCIGYSAGNVTVISGYKTDAILRVFDVGGGPSALAWSPFYSRMYVSNHDGSCITVIRDTIGPGVEDEQLLTSSFNPRATVMRGVLFVNGLGIRSGLSEGPVMSRAALLDAGGRKVLDLRPGANDVRALAPGVYFVRYSAGEVVSTGRLTIVR